MDRVHRVLYTDAQFSYNSELPDSRLRRQEAYGYLTENSNAYVLFFIKPQGVSTPEIIATGSDIVKGLIIPKPTEPIDMSSISVGSEVIVRWRDVVYVANMPRFTLSIMETRGVVARFADDHIVLSRPVTKKVEPLPELKHPEEGEPTFLLLPNSCIESVAQQ